MDFTTRFKMLNANQKKAVDTIDGPVMVIAGPGTGKTELLGMRAANILRKTDTLPSNILCLTFTESGASAMRERLTSIIGKDAYKVAIHTFHSFGSEVINQNGEYFYQGAQFSPADELSSYQILRSIFSELDYTNPLASTMNGEYTHLKDTLSSISELKRSGLTSDELLQIIDANEALLDTLEPSLASVFSERISKKTLPLLIPIATLAAEYPEQSLPLGITPLANVIALSLAHAIDEATASGKTTALTAWKNRWLTKNDSGEFQFKSRKQSEKLRAVSHIYFQYLSRMQEAELYDYDDMILRVVHAMEVFDDLRFNLQEKYQYIMVDEFQDTNLAQMRILANLTNNPVQGDTPNILVVGDDDQAIYSFQGADISNIMTFRTQYPKTELITLTDNYRSTEAVLVESRSVITQGNDRLEQHLDELDKTLTAHKTGETTVSLHEAATIDGERQWLVDNIASSISSGAQPGDTAVLARRHHEIVALLPYFERANIPVSYERRDNVLELEPIILIEQIARFVLLLHSNDLLSADAALPELLAHPAFGIEPTAIWQLSVAAYDGRKRWFDTMATMPEFSPLHGWFVRLSVESATKPLEYMLDLIVGSTKPIQTVDTEQEEDPFISDETIAARQVYISPLYSYFFSESQLQNAPGRYVQYLEALRTIRTKLREYQPDQTPTLHSFIAFISLHKKLGTTVSSIHSPSADDTSAVHLMTAHKSKGLEFETVYVVGAIDSMWGERVRSRSRSISYPENLPLAPAGDSPDERIRLFFVAMTRAKRNLHISYALANDAGKAQLPASFLLHAAETAEHIEAGSSLAQQASSAERAWYDTVAAPTADLAELLAPTLERYKLSATHLGNFLDVTRGGPQTFLLNNLLRFPQAMSSAAAYGSAIHATLQHTHAHLSATGKHRAVEDILSDFETNLAAHRLSDQDEAMLLQKGVDTLQTFLSEKYDSFTESQKVELNFASQHSIVGKAHLTGSLDLVDLDQSTKAMTVTDYKTGKPSRSWSGKTDYEKIKLHKYRQQLMFYKLLVEHSRDYNSYTVENGVLQFVEPTPSGEIVALDASFSSEDLERFTVLIDAVWRHITTLSLPDISAYEQSYSGIVAFEQDLIDNI